MNLGFLKDSNGDWSSGRLQKLTSLIISIILIIAGFVAILIAPTNLQISSYCLASGGMYLAVATGSELVQKIVGR